LVGFSELSLRTVEFTNFPKCKVIWKPLSLFAKLSGLSQIDTLFSNKTIGVVFKLAQDFGRPLRKREGQCVWNNGKPLSGPVSGIAELIAFADGLTDDAEAVASGYSLTWSNGMVEGSVNKVKWIKRSSYGQARFALLQRRVLLHPVGDALHKK
jgi:Transposase